MHSLKTHCPGLGSVDLLLLTQMTKILTNLTVRMQKETYEKRAGQVARQEKEYKRKELHFRWKIVS